MASGLILNWEKSCGYWISNTNRPNWTASLDVTWVDDGTVSKLLDTSIGLNMTIQNIDMFLRDKLDKKLRYWCTTEINSNDRGVIVNSILLSTFTYFSAI